MHACCASTANLCNRCNCDTVYYSVLLQLHVTQLVASKNNNISVFVVLMLFFTCIIFDSLLYNYIICYRGKTDYKYTNTLLVWLVNIEYWQLQLKEIYWAADSISSSMFSFISTQHLIKSAAVDFCLNIVMPTNALRITLLKNIKFSFVCCHWVCWVHTECTNSRVDNMISTRCDQRPAHVLASPWTRCLLPWTAFHVWPAETNFHQSKNTTALAN